MATQVAISSIKQGGMPRSRHLTWVIAETPEAVITFTPRGTPEWFYRFGDGTTRYDVIAVYPLREAWNSHFSYGNGELHHVYINIASPVAYVPGESLFYVDQHLDIWINADGTYEVLDEDEFDEAITEGLYTPEEAEATCAACAALVTEIETKTGLYTRMLAELPKLQELATGITSVPKEGER